MASMIFSVRNGDINVGPSSMGGYVLLKCWDEDGQTSVLLTEKDSCLLIEGIRKAVQEVEIRKRMEEVKNA